MSGPDRYTHYPRAILWLVRGGEAAIGGKTVSVQSFYLSKLPLTNVQFEAFHPEFERSANSPDDDDIAVGVDFEQARGYCEWYAGVSRKPMRLPTDTEWEYACGAQTTASDPDRHIWHAGNSGDTVPNLNKKRPNPFGLLGMLGGVWEWTDSGALRGGSFRTPLEEIESGVRRSHDPPERADDIGFRVARSLK